jgi:hypothetical protein
MYKQETMPTGGASAGDYVAALNTFWAETGRLTDLQIEEVLKCKHGGRLKLPTFADIVPVIEENVKIAREYVGWLETMGLAVLVAVEDQQLLVRDFGYDHEDLHYAALATPIMEPSIELQVPMQEPFALGFVESNRLPPDQRFVFTQLLGKH